MHEEHGMKGAILKMEFQDKVLTCIDCGGEFIFTSGEQLFFHDKQFKNEPKRCKSCKTRRVAVLGAAPPVFGNGNGHRSGPGHTQSYQFAKVETRATCSQCGKETTVPFRPTQNRPVFCRECFQSRRSAVSA
jgi:CxxC-x17-CxxC domain-containing protein